MVSGDITIFQVYYDAKSRAQLDSQFVPHFNASCTKYFETQILLDLYDDGKMNGCTYFGVVSWRIWQKIKRVGNLAALIAADEGKSDFFYAGLRLESQVWQHSEEYLQCDLTSWTEILMRELGYDVRLRELDTTGCFYNYQICRTPLYRQYVEQFLRPMMVLMEDKSRVELQRWLNEEVAYERFSPWQLRIGHIAYWLLKPLPSSTRMAIMNVMKNIGQGAGAVNPIAMQANTLMPITGFPHYTKHAFIGELLFPTYAAIKGWQGRRFN